MILASQSPRRRELLLDAGFELEIVPADIDEARLDGESPTELVGRLAEEKAEAVRSGLTHVPADGLLVAADTIVWMGDEALGKPADARDAARMLRELSGRTHQVATGVALIVAHAKNIEPVSFVEVTDVTFFDLTDDEIDGYVKSGEPMDKAGAYGIQGVGGRMLVQKIDGDFYNVVGLPIARTVRTIARLEAQAGIIC